MPLIFTNNTWKYRPFNWDTFLDRLKINFLISDSLKNNIIKSDEKVVTEFLQTLNNKPDRFYYSLPFYCTNYPTQHLDIRFNIDNIHSYINKMNLKSIYFDISYIPSDPTLELKDFYDNVPITCWKKYGSSIILDGNHRIQYAKKQGQSSIQAYIINEIHPDFFCDSISYHLFQLWNIQQRWNTERQ